VLLTWTQDVHRTLAKHIKHDCLVGSTYVWNSFFFFSRFICSSLNRRFDCSTLGLPRTRSFVWAVRPERRHLVPIWQEFISVSNMQCRLPPWLLHETQGQLFSLSSESVPWYRCPPLDHVCVNDHEEVRQTLFFQHRDVFKLFAQRGKDDYAWCPVITNILQEYLLYVGFRLWFES
jgi:hypothetical protein